MSPKPKKKKARDFRKLVSNTKSGRTFFNYDEDSLKNAVEAINSGMTVSFFLVFMF